MPSCASWWPLPPLVATAVRSSPVAKVSSWHWASTGRKGLVQPESPGGSGVSALNALGRLAGPEEVMVAGEAAGSRGKSFSETP